MKEEAIEEEGLLGMDDDEDDDAAHGGLSGIPKRVRYTLGFVGAFFGLFFFFALILWGASRNQRPVVTLRAVTFHRFVVQAGTDASLVPTEMASLNATVRLVFRNTGTFFGVHVSADPVTLYYTQLQLASGNVSKRHSYILLVFFFRPCSDFYITVQQQSICLFLVISTSSSRLWIMTSPPDVRRLAQAGGLDRSSLVVKSLKSPMIRGRIYIGDLEY
jgi:hypothetical protein